MPPISSGHTICFFSGYFSGGSGSISAPDELRCESLKGQSMGCTNKPVLKHKYNRIENFKNENIFVG